MDKLLDKIFDFDKIPAKLVLLLWIFSGTILFIPTEFISRLNLDAFSHAHGKYIGVTFLLSSGFLIVTAISLATNFIRKKRLGRRLKQEIIESLHNLDEYEKSLLREFIINNRSALQLPIDDSSVNGLHTKGILYKVSQNGFVYIHGVYFSFSITKIAEAEIRNNRHLVGVPNMSEGITMDQHKDILKRRPSWAKTKSYFD